MKYRIRIILAVLAVYCLGASQSWAFEYESIDGRLTMDCSQEASSKPCHIVFIANPKKEYSNIEWRSPTGEHLGKMTMHQKSRSISEREHNHFTLYTAGPNGETDQGRLYVDIGDDVSRVLVSRHAFFQVASNCISLRSPKGSYFSKCIDNQGEWETYPHKDPNHVMPEFKTSN